jgi:glycosidase
MAIQALRLFGLFFLLVLSAAAQASGHQAWTRNANIYEVNIRQSTPEGTIAAFQKQLPRLQKMGVKILWIMPVQPIGVKNRKGGMGSYYSIQDYTAINPEFGTMADFKQLVAVAHKMGFKVILDWVANHSAWDNGWAQEHPEWYKKNAKGEITSYEYNNGREIEYWTDVIGFDYKQPALWDAMIGAMAFWVREADIDGFRCDVAGLVPTPFWQRARKELERIKPLFMLAESNDPLLHPTFDMTYDWALFDLLSDIAVGKGDARDLVRYAQEAHKKYPADAYQMTFTSNHDINSWRWSDTERYGAGFRTFAVLAMLMPGMPLIYNGQESGLAKKIAFFEKDAIDWSDYKNADFYAELLRLKSTHPALRNGIAGAPIEIIGTGNTNVFAFRRAQKKRMITVIANLTGAPQKMTGIHAQTLGPWDYKISAR